MTATRGLFVRQTGAAPNAIGTTPLEARLAMAGLVHELSPGVPRSGIMTQSTAQLVTASTTDMSYNVAPCNPVVSRTAAEGVYMFSLTGTTNVGTDAAPGTGSRYDLIYVRQHDPDKGDADNLPEIGVVRGQSSTGTPTKPYSNVPAGGYVLAEAQIFSGTSSTSGGSNTISQVWGYQAARGAILPVLSLADRNAITAPRVGTQVRRLDRNNHVQEWNGTAWKWISKPERYDSVGSQFTTATSTVSRLIAEIAGIPTRSYATRVTVKGQMSVSCAAISSGDLQIQMCLSAAVNVVGSAQAKAYANYYAPGSNWETRYMDTGAVLVAANATPLARAWIAYVTGSVATAASNDGTLSHIWAEILPEDD